MFDSIDKILASTKEARQHNNKDKILMNAQACLDYLPAIIKYEVEQEHQYRVYEAKLTQERDEVGKLRTSSYCETHAKATQFYAEYRKAQLFRDLLYEVVMMSKKIAKSGDQELNAQ